MGSKRYIVCDRKWTYGESTSRNKKSAWDGDITCDKFGDHENERPLELTTFGKCREQKTHSSAVVAELVKIFLKTCRLVYVTC